MAKLFNLVKVNTATAGTGDVTFGAAFSNAFFTPSEAGAVDGDSVSYVLVEGDDTEIGTGVIGSSVTTMTRTVLKSKIGGVAGTTKMTLGGTAYLAFTALNRDISAPQAINTQVFTASGTFTTPADSTTSTVYRYRMVGGGGGGGGSSHTGAAAGGGGGGAYAEGTFTGVAPSTGITVTVGALGSGGAIGVTGVAGTSSSIGSPVSITAGGGSPGVGVAVASPVDGGAGGTVTGSPNILSITGQKGLPGAKDTAGNSEGGGDGANSLLGAGGRGGRNSIGTPGLSASGYGSGGGGGFYNSGTGGNGTPGVVVIDWVL